MGIDAAWTTKNPSGVALVLEMDGRWRLVRIASSCGDFVGLPATAPHDLDPATLIDAAISLSGYAPTLIAVDMPLARTPIVGRRLSDNLVSTVYGARHAGTHTPSATRPGPISDGLVRDLEQLGYPLVTRGPATGGLIEVYPHPALIELTEAEKRLPYKESKIGKYWPALSATERRLLLLGQWDVILRGLAEKIDGLEAMLKLPEPTSPRVKLKAFEDMLDAIVCAWVGICALDGKAIPYGDELSTIWIPTPR